MKFITSTIFLLWSFNVCGQQSPLEKKTDTTAQNIKRYYNNQKVDSIYSLTNTFFQSKIKLTVLQNALQQQLFPFGKITALAFERSKDSVNYYKASLGASVELTMLVGLDAAGKVATFGLQPYKPLVSDGSKRKNIYNDNALLTPIDSLIHQYANKYMEAAKTPGLSIGILIDTKSYFYNYGEAKKGQDVHPTRNTVFEIGSITKTFTAWLLADAVFINLISLKSPITQYLPDSVALNDDLQKITVEQLSNHSSGLPRLANNYLIGSNNVLDPYAAYDNAALFAYLKSYKATRKPGDKYEYSNLAVGLLGVLLERVYQMPLESLYYQKIFAPLKMKSTFGTTIKDSSTAAQGYDENGKETNYWNFKSMAAAGAIKSNTEDLIKYAVPFALMPRTKGKYDPRILLLKKITFNQPPAIVSLNWHFDTTDSTNFTMNHSGGTGGFRSNISIMPAKKLAIVVLANCADEAGAPVIADALLKELKALIKD